MTDPYFVDEHVTLHHGDAFEVLREMPDASIDAIVTDPPYDLTAGKKGGSGQASLNVNSPAGRARIASGFMGLGWDATGIAFRPDVWIECLRVLKPGGHLLAFGGSRTWHRLVCAIEDAGFEVRDSIAWLYGSGFPKSLDVARTIEPASEEAARWRGWGTALKPAFEPVVVARKPLAGTVGATVLAHGTGAINIDACRTASAGGNPTLARRDSARRSGRTPQGGAIMDNRSSPQRYLEERAGEQLGRWPTNVVLDGGAADELDRQTGVLTSGANPTRRGSDKFRDTYGEFKGQEKCTPARGVDAGGASRFFPVFRYEAKAGTAERPRDGDTAHPTVKPLDLIRWLVRLVTPPGGVVLDPFAGSGTTGEACIVEGFRCVLVEREAAYLPLIVARLSKPIQPDLFGGGVAMTLPRERSPR